MIEQSNRDFKIFWGWLYGVIVRLMDEAIPEDIAAVSQQDTIYLAEFLSTFDEYCEIDNGKTILHIISLINNVLIMHDFSIYR